MKPRRQSWRSGCKEISPFSEICQACPGARALRGQRHPCAVNSNAAGMRICRRANSFRPRRFNPEGNPPEPAPAGASPAMKPRRRSWRSGCKEISPFSEICQACPGARAPRGQRRPCAVNSNAAGMRICRRANSFRPRRFNPEGNPPEPAPAGASPAMRPRRRSWRSGCDLSAPPSNSKIERPRRLAGPLLSSTLKIGTRPPPGRRRR